MFGDNAKNFSYTESGNLVYYGKTKDFSKDQKALYKGMSSLMGEEKTTNVIYAESYAIGEGESAETLNTAEFGGALMRRDAFVDVEKLIKMKRNEVINIDTLKKEEYAVIKIN